MKKTKKLLTRIRDDIRLAYQNDEIETFLRENMIDIRYMIDKKLEYVDSLIMLRDNVMISTMSFSLQCEDELLDLDEECVLKIDYFINIWYNELVTDLFYKKNEEIEEDDSNIHVDIIAL